MHVTRPSGAGGSRSALYRGVKAGVWDRIARGLYVPVDAPVTDWDQLEAVTRRPESTICLLSALAQYDLTDEIPDALDVAIPRGVRAPVVDGAIRWHHFDRESFAIERHEIPIPGGDQTIGIYTPERTIADCYRLRGSIGYEIARDATKVWLSRGGKPARLLEVASQLPRAKSPVLRALEVMA